jgi:hypothetical protein
VEKVPLGNKFCRVQRLILHLKRVIDLNPPNKKPSGKDIYVYIFLFWTLVVIPSLLLSMYVKNVALMLLGFLAIGACLVLAIFSIVKSWKE